MVRHVVRYDSPTARAVARVRIDTLPTPTDRHATGRFIDYDGRVVTGDPDRPN